MFGLIPYFAGRTASSSSDAVVFRAARLGRILTVTPGPAKSENRRAEMYFLSVATCGTEPAIDVGIGVSHSPLRCNRWTELLPRARGKSRPCSPGRTTPVPKTPEPPRFPSHSVFGCGSMTAAVLNLKNSLRLRKFALIASTLNDPKTEISIVDLISYSQINNVIFKRSVGIISGKRRGCQSNPTIRPMPRIAICDGIWCPDRHLARSRTINAEEAIVWITLPKSHRVAV